MLHIANVKPIKRPYKPTGNLRSSTYRADYLRENPGYLKMPLWICAYCGKILVGKKSLRVDHIAAVSKTGINSTWNLVSSCEDCNSKKSDKMGMWAVRGYAAKLLLGIVNIGQKVFLGQILFILYALFRIVRFVVKNFVKAIVFIIKLLLKPLITFKILGKIVTLVIYLAVAYLIYTRLNILLG